MNKFIQAIKVLDLAGIEELLQKDPKWIAWSEDSGKNALHYLCGLPVSGDERKSGLSLQFLKLLLKYGMDINSVHKIPDHGEVFPATPLWYAYTRGRNEKLYNYLLKKGADPGNCMFAIAWNNDVKSAGLFKKYGAELEGPIGGATPFLAAFNWKRFDVAHWFLKNGADVDFADPKGNTALFYAVKRKYSIDLIKLLLKSGADFNKTNKDGMSPKLLAGLNHQRKIESLFEMS